MTQKTYSYDEAYEATLEYFGGDQLAAKVWTTKYALKDADGNLYEKSPLDMHHRIAREIARIEAQYPNGLTEIQVVNLLDHFQYLVPQGSPMTGIGNNLQIASLSNCFVIGLDGPSDSYGAIFKIDEEQVQLMKRRGGVGHDMSGIRPKGSLVRNSALTSTGLVPFMKRFSNSTREVAQDGRRGALMLSCSIKHPDVADFIDAKMEEGAVTGANVSVRITDDFMEAVRDDKDFTLRFPVDSEGDPKYTKVIKARELWGRIIHNAWKSAEPGVLFWDTILKESIPDCYADFGFETISTNPCGEIPLCPYDSCRLLAVNLYGYVRDPFTDHASFDFDLFREHIGCAQRLMDDIIDLEKEKIDTILAKIKSDPESDEIKYVEHHLWEKIREKTLKGRRTGLGITGEGDMLAALGLRYGTKEAIDFAVKVQQTLALSAYRSSVTMAQERGAFEIYDPKREEDNPFILRIKEADPKLYEDMVKHGRRNIACLTIAPTGSTSLMTQTTSGIEPVFMPVYKRRRKVNSNEVADSTHPTFTDETGDVFEEFIVYHPKFRDWMKASGIPTDKEYTQEEIDALVERSPYHKATANDVDWVSKVKMQGAMQKWVDHSISVTVNLPNDVDEELVNTLYLTAWEAGCKGCTIYREGSRDGVLLSTKKKEEKKEPELPTLTFTADGMEPLKRPDELEADIIRFQNNKERWIAFIGMRDGRPYEIFTGIDDEDEGLYIPKRVTQGKIIKVYEPDGSKHYDFEFSNKRGLRTTVAGLDEKFNPEFWNYAKFISSVLRYGMPIDQVVNLVRGLDLGNESINTWKNGVERALRRYITSGTVADGQTCPNCGSHQLVYQEGCLICKDCGTSRCG
ncbi:adenosylcobalamin-dependent ribonucleoside-diphosphate reductase [uncultured Porphyromonas sp.]|uniref:adenosylcobalamin-dependent ribonucleoside-diphosphate reductase n=1 Tax=uncultured Porphyromonas sp. TaxID=159274 RepID=UPI00261FF707|nr:adenosylcobalamin-dependent ribonucleoside-diphosphate reductase [uncultured Porphyromonas sp.]